MEGAQGGHGPTPVPPPLPMSLVARQQAARSTPFRRNSPAHGEKIAEQVDLSTGYNVHSDLLLYPQSIYVMMTRCSAFFLGRVFCKFTNTIFIQCTQNEMELHWMARHSYLVIADCNGFRKSSSLGTTRLREVSGKQVIIYILPLV